MEAVKPYTEWTVAELREELGARQLKVSGNQPELIERLQQNDQDEVDRAAAAAAATLEPGDKTVTNNPDGTITTTTDGHTATTVDQDGNLVSGSDPAPAEVTDEDELTRKQKVVAGVCVVDDGTPHTGRAVNGVICSAHAMRYDAAGRLRNG